MILFSLGHPSIKLNCVVTTSNSNRSVRPYIRLRWYEVGTREKRNFGGRAAAAAAAGVPITATPLATTTTLVRQPPTTAILFKGEDSLYGQ